MLESFSTRRSFWLGLAVAGLASVFLFQHVDVVSWFCECNVNPNTRFALRKFVRVLLNDSFMLLLIHAWFYEKRISRIAWYIQMIDILILFPLYLLIKLNTEGHSEISSPLLSQFHRLIVNPTLMVLVIPAVYYERLTRSRRG
jgi:exosortase F-associated protein